jgi:hypothetical protein
MTLSLFLIAVIVSAVGIMLVIPSVISLGWRKWRKKHPAHEVSLMDGQPLTDWEMVRFGATGGIHQCPDCGADLKIGPTGGMSVNFRCDSSECGSRFNYVGPFGVERISNAAPNKKPVGQPLLGPYRSK